MPKNCPFNLNLEHQFLHEFSSMHPSILLFYASCQGIRILVLVGWEKNARRSIVSIRHSVYLSGYGTHSFVLTFLQVILGEYYSEQRVGSDVETQLEVKGRR